MGKILTKPAVKGEAPEDTTPIAASNNTPENKPETSDHTESLIYINKEINRQSSKHEASAKASAAVDQVNPASKKSSSDNQLIRGLIRRLSSRSKRSKKYKAAKNSQQEQLIPTVDTSQTNNQLSPEPKAKSPVSDRSDPVSSSSQNSPANSKFTFDPPASAPVVVSCPTPQRSRNGDSLNLQPQRQAPGTPKSLLSVNQHLYSDSKTVESLSINDKNSLNSDNASVLTLHSGRINGQFVAEANSSKVFAKSPIAVESNFEKAVVNPVNRSESHSPSNNLTESEVIQTNEVATKPSSQDQKEMSHVISSQPVQVSAIGKSSSLATSLDTNQPPADGAGDRAKDGSYYTSLLTSITEEIKQNIATVEKFQAEAKAKEESSSSITIPDEAVGLINSFTGASNLLIASKFKQFLGLCSQNLKLQDLPAGSKDENGDPLPTNDDLTGFFELISIQISQMSDRYETIVRWKENNWEEPKIPEKKMNISSYSTPCINVKNGKSGNSASRPTSAQSAKSEGKGKSGSGTPVSKRATKSKQASSALREQIKAARKAKMLQEKQGSEDIVVVS